MTNILILGHKGMLGHMVHKVLSDSYEIKTINERFPNWNKELFDGIDLIINCIGAIPQKTEEFDINWQIPLWLDKNTDCNIIHPATDCEVDNSSYGISKKQASNYIKDHCKTTKIKTDFAPARTRNQICADPHQMINRRRPTTAAYDYILPIVVVLRLLRLLRDTTTRSTFAKRALSVTS